MPDQSCATLLKASVTGQSRSSSASTLRKASKSFPEDGSSSAPSHGSTAAGDWPKIGKNPSQVHRHGYSLHISEPSRVKLQGIVIIRRVLNQTLSYLGDVLALGWQYSPWPRFLSWVFVAATSLIFAFVGGQLASIWMGADASITFSLLLIIRWAVSSIPARFWMD